MIYFAWEEQLGFPLSWFIEIKLNHVGIKTNYDHQNNQSMTENILKYIR